MTLSSPLQTRVSFVAAPVSANLASEAAQPHQTHVIDQIMSDDVCDEAIPSNDIITDLQPVPCRGKFHREKKDAEEIDDDYVQLNTEGKFDCVCKVCHKPYHRICSGSDMPEFCGKDACLHILLEMYK